LCSYLETEAAAHEREKIVHIKNIHIMKIVFKIVGLCIAFIAWTVVSHAQDTTRKQTGDLDFASKATASNNFELQAASIALAKSQDANIKQYAQMINEEHTAAGNELSTLVKSKNWQLSTSDNEKFGAMIDQLNNVDPANFDRVYADIMTKTHEEAIALFKDASTGTATTDVDLRKFAADKIPAFEKHLDQIKNIKPATGSINNMPPRPGTPSPVAKSKVPKPILK
jgi:putative membrane protein